MVRANNKLAKSASAAKSKNIKFRIRNQIRMNIVVAPRKMKIIFRTKEFLCPNIPIISALIRTCLFSLGYLLVSMKSI